MVRKPLNPRQDEVLQWLGRLRDGVAGLHVQDDRDPHAGPAASQGLETRRWHAEI